MTLPVIVLGAGGHAQVVVDTLLSMHVPIIGYCAPDNSTSGILEGLDYLGDDNALGRISVDEVLLVNGLGSVATVENRAKLFNRFKSQGFHFASVIHPSVVIARGVDLGEGCQIMAGSVIQPGVQCGDNVIINTCSSVDHDSMVGVHTHIAIGARISGTVTIGEKVHVGAGSTIIQGVSIGNSCTLGAGTVVIRDIADNESVVGVPAHRLTK